MLVRWARAGKHNVEGSYILRPLRVVTRVRRWRLAAGEGRESRRVVAEAARSDLHTLTHTYTHLHAHVSVTAGAVAHGFACTRGARGRRTSRRKGGEDPRGLADSRGCLVVQRLARTGRNMVLVRPLHAHMLLPMSMGTKFVHIDIALHETVLVLPRAWMWTLDFVVFSCLGARTFVRTAPQRIC